MEWRGRLFVVIMTDAILVQELSRFDMEIAGILES